MTTAEKQARLRELDAERQRNAAERQHIEHVRARAVANGESADHIARLGKRVAALAEREREIAAATQLLSRELAEDREREQRDSMAAAEATAERTRTAYSDAVQAARAKLQSFAREFAITYDGLARAENEARIAWDAAIRAAGRDRRFERFEVPNMLPIDEALVFFHIASLVARYGGSQCAPVPSPSFSQAVGILASSYSVRRGVETPNATNDAGDTVSRHITAINAGAQSRTNPLRTALP